MLAPSGRQLDEPLAAELAVEPHVALLCGRYEGVDERIREHLATDAVSVGPYVLSGGELAAMVIADAVIRKLPGALGHADSAVEESFSEALGGAPEYPHYTRPASYRGWEVPEVLISGDHARVREWRLEQSRKRAPWPQSAERRSLICPGCAPPRARVLAAESRSARSGAADAQATAPHREPMSTIIESIEQRQLKRVPRFAPGDRVRVHFQVVEGTRRRTQVFEGVVIARRGAGARETFTVRKQSFGVGVERTFPVHSPKIERLEVVAQG